MKLFKFYLTVLLTLFSIALFSQNEISACTDALACNYNNLATIDDGSCVYPESLNYSFLYNKQGWSGAGGCLVTHDDVGCSINDCFWQFTCNEKSSKSST